MEAKTLPADVCVFGRFGWVSPAAVNSADGQFDSRVKWWIHVSSIFMQKLLFYIETVANNALIIDTLFLINCEQTWHPF